MATHNPFHYGTPVDDEHFAGRVEELDALVARMRDGINVVLVSPRRYGKTSLLHAAERRLAASRPVGAVVEVNLLRAGSPARFAGLLTAGAYHMAGARWSRARQAVAEFLRRIRVVPSVSFDAAGNPRFGFDASLGPADVEAVLSDVYALLEETAARRPAALALDEFQAFSRLDPTLPDVLKGLADAHPAVSLVLAGSRRHLMEELVSQREAPLFGLAQHLAVGPIPEPEMVAYLVARAAAGGKTMGPDVAHHIIEQAGPVPNDIQHLAYDAFEGAGNRVDEAAVGAGMAAAVAHDAALFADAVARLPAGQARVLAAVAAEEPAEPYGAAFVRAVGLANASSVRKALVPLLTDDTVVERAGRLVVADPFLAAWLRADG